MSLSKERDARRKRKARNVQPKPRITQVGRTTSVETVQPKSNVSQVAQNEVVDSKTFGYATKDVPKPEWMK